MPIQSDDIKLLASAVTETYHPARGKGETAV